MTALLNLQPIEKRVVTDDGSLDVHSVFPTIQGEGPFAGVPAVFVRLAGCDLQCPLCDTDYTTGRRQVQVDDLFVEIRNHRNKGLVVMTGGEPFRQGCGRLVRKLCSAGFQVQFESNGTLYDETMDWGWPYPVISVVCSPKTAVLSKRMIRHIDHYKYVVSAGQVNPADGLPTSSLGMPAPPARPEPLFPKDRIWVQPCDDKDPVKNEANVQQAIASCQQFGYRFCLQVHKVINLP